MRNYAIVWLSGLMAGLILVERWRRVGADAPAADIAADGTGVSAVSPTTPPETPKMAASIIAGAKADVRRARHVLDQVMPWRAPSDPSLDEVRRWKPAATTTTTSTDVE